MSIYKYISDFMSRDGLTWSVEIVRRADDGGAAEVTVAEDFDFDLQAAVISWKQTEKWEPLQGSACTLRVVSPSDRTFIDLYAARPGDVVLRLSRNGALYWTGTLDPEFYQEPYTAASGYEVELTFSDLGALDRLTYDGATSGLVNFDALVRGALAAASLPEAYTLHTGLRKETDTAPITLGRLTVNGANFVDEEGEPMTWQEVLEGILQPLGLRIVQQGGAFVVYDLYSARALYPGEITWAADDATLGTDKVYNNIEVEFSPYGTATATTCEIKPEDVTVQGAEVLFKGGTAGDSYNSFAVGRGYHQGLPTILNNTRACIYRMTSYFGGEDSAGVGALIPANDGSIWFGECYVNNFGWTGMGLGPNTVADTSVGLFKAAEIHFSPTTDPENMLRISLEMLLDFRTNPFEDDAAKSKNKEVHSVYIPVHIWFEMPDKTKLYYCNSHIAKSTGSVSGGTWYSGTPAWDAAYLCYYNWSDIKKSTPLNGWMTNKPCIGHDVTTLPAMWEKRGAGEYIAIPLEVRSKGGTLHVEVYTDVSFGHGSEIPGWYIENGRMKCTAKWLLYKSVKVELVDSYGKAVESEDVVRQAALSLSASDPLTIDTICGTAVDTVPTARGVISLDKGVVTTLARGEISGTFESLLIAAIATQYDSRHTTLSGTVAASGFAMYGLYKDAAQPEGRVFVADEAEYDVQAGEVSARFTELSPQKYQPSETDRPLWPTI